MKRLYLSTAILILAHVVPTAAAAEQTLALADVFSDHMVVQRDEVVTVWGTAVPNSKLTVEFAGEKQQTNSDVSGNWSVSLPPMRSGGPHVLTVRQGNESRQFKDILLGDVWLCSGQSNMEMPISRVRSSAAALRRRHSETIRLFSVSRDTAATPQKHFATPPLWKVASADSLSDFSALCYFFATEIQKEDPVALGLIDASWGGSQLEAWLAADYLRTAGDYDESLEILHLRASDADAAMQRLGKQWEAWHTDASPGSKPMWASGPAAVENWSAMPQIGDWKQFGDPALADHNGLVWFRHSFEVDAEQAATGATVSVGRIHKGEVVWVNGEFVGRGYGWDGPRPYRIAKGLLKPGTNHVLVNIRSMWAQGGLMGPADAMAVTFDNGDRIPLSDQWHYRIDSPANLFPPTIPWGTVFGLTGMYNAMIAPLDGLQLRGAIWYQGESNARRASEYGVGLNALIRNWRNLFASDHLPFIVIQLPEFGSVYTEPAESDWASFRDQQRRVAVDDPNTGIVVAMGLGDPTDIHPTNKQDLAKRTAAVWRGLTARSAPRTNGFSPRRAISDGQRITVEFDPSTEGFVVHSADRPIAFELCSGEPLQCGFADAELEDNVVRLQSDDVQNPTTVRYCWGNSPICNLYTADGMPVGPFEIPVDR